MRGTRRSKLKNPIVCDALKNTITCKTIRGSTRPTKLSGWSCATATGLEPFDAEHSLIDHLSAHALSDSNESNLRCNNSRYSTSLKTNNGQSKWRINKTVSLNKVVLKCRLKKTLKKPMQYTTRSLSSDLPLRSERWDVLVLVCLASDPPIEVF